MPKKRCLDAGPGPDVRARLEALLARVRRVRKNLYPEGWTYDPLYHVEKELELLLQEMREKRPA
jgi:hypothetical protein